MLKSEVEAEELEKQAKEEFKLKNYEKSKLLFEKAKTLNVQLKYMGKVSVIDKQIAQIKRVLEYENRTKQILPTTNNVNNPSIRETEKTLNKSTIEKRKEENSAETRQYNDREKLISESELRRAKLREQSEKRERETEFRKTHDAKIKERDDIKKQALLKREEDQKASSKKDEERRISVKNAEITMDQAKAAIDSGEFNKARDFYKEAIDIFKGLGWYDQVGILYNEIKNLEKYKTEYLKKMTYESRKKQQSEEYFQKQAENLLEEKKQKEALKLASMQKLPPGINNIIDKVKLLKEKAEKEENAGIYERALNRYRYILELYNSIPQDKINLKEEISEIEKKINELSQ